MQPKTARERPTATKQILDAISDPIKLFALIVLVTEGILATLAFTNLADSILGLFVGYG